MRLSPPSTAPPAVSCIRLLVPGFGSALLARSRRGAQQFEPVPLLPLRRLAPAVQPIVSGAPRAAENGNDVGGGMVRNGLRERHGPNRRGKRKIGNAENTTCESRQCRHTPCMSLPIRHEAHVIACGKSRKAVIYETKQWFSVDFGLPIGVKIRNKKPLNIPNIQAIACDAAKAMNSLSKTHHRLTVEAILSNSPSTEEKLWCEGKKRRAE